MSEKCPSGSPGIVYQTSRSIRSKGIFSSYMLLDPRVPLPYYLVSLKLNKYAGPTAYYYYSYLRNKHGC